MGQVKKENMISTMGRGKYILSSTSAYKLEENVTKDANKNS